MLTMHVVVVLVSCAALAVAQQFPAALGSYRNTELLGNDVFLFWEVVGQAINFEVHATATGYVGFGISKTATMAGADMTVGFVMANGQPYLGDSYAKENGLPSIDTQRDWKLLNLTKINGTLAIRFSRLLDTGDCANDTVITPGMVNIIWSHSDQDPPAYHELNRGHKLVQLLDDKDPGPQGKCTSVVKSAAGRMRHGAFLAPLLAILLCLYR